MNDRYVTETLPKATRQCRMNHMRWIHRHEEHYCEDCYISFNTRGGQVPCNRNLTLRYWGRRTLLSVEYACEPEFQGTESLYIAAGITKGVPAVICVRVRELILLDGK